MKGVMEDTSLPEWQKYYADLERHEQFIKNYKFFLDRIVTHLNWLGERRKRNEWTPDDIARVLGSEIDQSWSMDAPNKPGYYRANND